MPKDQTMSLSLLFLERPTYHLAAAMFDWPERRSSQSSRCVFTAAIILYTDLTENTPRLSYEAVLLLDLGLDAVQGVRCMDLEADRPARRVLNIDVHPE